MENPMDDLGVPPFSETSICTDLPVLYGVDGNRVVATQIFFLFSSLTLGK